jgi:hypothetical protein
MINLYKKGQKVRCSVDFRVDEVLTDPSIVNFKFKKPSGGLTMWVYGTDIAVVRESTGLYYADVITDEKGEWSFRFEGTGICTAVEEASFNVTTLFDGVLPDENPPTSELTALLDAHIASGDHPYYNVKSYGAIGDGVADDRDAIQAAINAAYANGGGIVFLHAGTYLLGSSLVPKRGVTIRGVYPGATSTSPISWDLGFTVDTGTIITYPEGVVFQQDTSAGLGTLSSLNGVIIESLGFKNVASIITCGSSNRAGLDGCVVRNIIASGVTGVAFDLINILQCHFQNIRAECKQFIRVTNDYDITVIGHESGNSYFEDVYCYITTAGHDTPAIHLRSYELSGNGTQLNFIHMTRVQVNRMLSDAEPGAGHLLLEGTTNSIIYGCTFTGLDLEGEAEFNVKGTNVMGCNFDFVTITYRESAPAMHLRNCSHIVVKNTALDFWMDLDATNENITLIGMLAGVQGGGVRPLGFYTDRSVDTRRADFHKRIVTYSYETPDYSNLHGSGIRTSAMIAITTSGPTMWGVLDNSLYRYFLIDGDLSTGGYCNNGVSVVNEWMEFDFTTPRLITEVNFKFNQTMSGGTFKWQGWDGSGWVDIGSTFILGAAVDQFVDLSSNHFGYTKYRYIGTLGISSWDTSWKEILFKIGNPA